MTTTFVFISAVLGFFGVAFGAFGAHALRRHFGENRNLEANFKTAVQYHMAHVPALLFVAWMDSFYQSGWIAAAGWLFVIGIVLFAGSLYLMALTGNRMLGAITPLGGLAFLAGWACLAIAALTINP